MFVLKSITNSEKRAEFISLAVAKSAKHNRITIVIQSVDMISLVITSILRKG
ncbi:hypothetical protein [uncultured Aquimarina sp.]|uniref:hypothetical protein n=1 Tax=uncultured Aquimarina sp. TaxID=575652 RepID=UPI002613BF71|nr:hypothetical protein [uncultured Aquimarina sp.]